ncbi:riboflavin kinase (plasmid) [Sphingobium xenophagum]|nr:riboflavin kinase [Sphingobium xenophagum]
MREMLAQKSACQPLDVGTRLTGQVVSGDQLGRTIGFPTANLVITGSDKPQYGIYASLVRLADGRLFGGATNFGVRPTFSPPKELLETYIFDFSEDIYGQYIDVELLRFLRPEAKFDALADLIDQMKKDCSLAREIVASHV